MKLPHRRRFLHLVAGAAALPVIPHIAFAQAYPSRPVRIIVGFAPGQAIDIVTRMIGQWLSEQLGQQFIIENRPGAGGNIATEAVVRAPPDGYTLLAIGSNNMINATLYEKLNYAFIRDIAPVASIYRVAQVMEVNPSFPAKTVPEFITYANAHPGQISFASAGNGSVAHVTGALFKMMTGVNMLHVPYRGATPAVTATTRWQGLPDVPTLGDFVPGFETNAWAGIGAPKNTPAEIIDTLNREINVALADPTIKARFAELGGEVLALSPSEYGKRIAEETEKWAKVIQFSGAKPD